MRDEIFGVRLNDTERKLLEHAATKEGTSQSAIARRGLVQEARTVLTTSNVKVGTE